MLIWTNFIDSFDNDVANDNVDNDVDLDEFYW